MIASKVGEKKKKKNKKKLQDEPTHIVVPDNKDALKKYIKGAQKPTETDGTVGPNKSNNRY